MEGNRIGREREKDRKMNYRTELKKDKIKCSLTVQCASKETGHYLMVHV